MGENQAKGNLKRDKIPKKEKWTGHILRQENESIVKKALECNAQGGARRKSGRPRITWRSTVRMEADHERKS
jgi:hypothetical protein